MRPRSKPRPHMSRQFTYVVHGSSLKIPVHEVPSDDFQPIHANTHPEFFHAGTPRAAREAALSTARVDKDATFHLYRIHRDAMEPIMYGDVVSEGPRASATLSGLQTGLFEHHAIMEDALEERTKTNSPKVIPYRNYGEDPGYPSYIIPKAAVGRGVDYLGSVNGRDFRDRGWTIREV